MTKTKHARAAAGLAALAGCAFLLGGCYKTKFNIGKVIDQVERDSVAHTLILIGDAGLPARGGEPVLKALTAEIRAHDEERTTVVYLGDNIYPRGLTDSTTLAERREGERALNEQVDAVLATGARGILVPGNHDWDAGSSDGIHYVRRQDRYVDERGKGRVTVLPDNGCPGPAVVELDRVARLIVLDTQWWLQPGGSRPEGPGSTCSARTEEEVVDSIRSALGTAGARRTVVVGHHPLVSGGQHGGYFDWPSYLFPLHPWARLGGIFARQDVRGEEYRNLRRSMTRAFTGNAPLIYAAGHEHSLQVFRRAPARYQIVSGGGIYNHTTPVRAITGTQYARRASGFQRVTFLRNGRVRLAVLVVDANGRTREDFSVFLDTEGLPPVISTEAELPPPGNPSADSAAVRTGQPRTPAPGAPRPPAAPAPPAATPGARP